MHLLLYHSFGHHEELEMDHEMSYEKCFVVNGKLQNGFANLTQIVLSNLQNWPRHPILLLLNQRGYKFEYNATYFLLSYFYPLLHTILDFTDCILHL